MPSREELNILQNYPLELKIKKTQQRIREWVNYFGVDNVYISFSGGKDSTVLLHIVRQMYPDIEAVFCDTGLEYPQVRQFAKSFDNLTILRPEMSFYEVIRKYGYPFIGKDVSLTLEYARKGSKWALNNLNGLDKNGIKSSFKASLFSKYIHFLDFDFLTSSHCCIIIKERPLDLYAKKNNKVPFVATIAEESLRRTQAWLKTGCNVFNGKKQVSKPLSFWTNQDILEYIKLFNLSISSVYGQIVYGKRGYTELYDNLLCDCGQELCTTGADRTGCIYCGYGCHNEVGESRFQRLKRTHPKQYAYCMGGGAYDTDGHWKPNKDGLGMAHCIDEINKIYGKDFIKY